MEKKTNNPFLVVGFLTIVASFSIATWMISPQQISVDENRKLAEFPRLSRRLLMKFPQAFEAYFNDRFFSRTTLVKARNWVRLNCLQMSTAPSVLVGKNGWFYFLGEANIILSPRDDAYTPQELNQWKESLAARTKYLAAKGIKYVFVVAPNKQSVYPEFLPKRQPGKTRYDELRDFLKNSPEISFVDLKEALLEGKEESVVSGNLFHKTDTHWNELGAFIADRYLSAKLSTVLPGIQPLAMTQFNFQKVGYKEGDCPKLMGLYGWIKESAPSFSALSSEPALKFEQGNDLTREISTLSISNKASDTDTNKDKDNDTGTDTKMNSKMNSDFCTNNKSLRLPKALVFHDSFGDNLKPFLARHFSETVFQKRPADVSLDLDLIEKEKPDIVIQEIVERHAVQLMAFPPHDWRHEFCDAIALENKQHPHSASSNSLCVLPFTAEVNPNRLTEVLRSPHSSTVVNSCREWVNDAAKITFDEKKADDYQWYVTKSGEQGKWQIKDPESAKAYANLLSFIQTSGKYVVEKKIVLFDQTDITLWKRVADPKIAEAKGAELKVD